MKDLEPRGRSLVNVDRSCAARIRAYVPCLAPWVDFDDVYRGASHDMGRSGPALYLQSNSRSVVPDR